MTGIEKKKLKTIVCRNENVAFRKIGDEYLLVPIVNTTGDLDEIYVLNEVGARLWELLEDACTLHQLKGTIVDEFNAPSDQIENDVNSFIDELEQLGVITLKRS